MTDKFIQVPSEPTYAYRELDGKHTYACPEEEITLVVKDGIATLSSPTGTVSMTEWTFSALSFEHVNERLDERFAKEKA